MARILGAFPASLLAAHGGLSANAFYRRLKNLGVGATRSEVLALFKISKAIVAKSGQEVFQDPTLVPTGQDLVPWPVRTATGVKQNVTLTYRDKTTGEIKVTYYSVTSPNGITREEAVSEAIGAYADASERYNQDLIGAVHTGAYQLVPIGTD